MELVRKQINGYRILQSRVQQFEQQLDLIIPDVHPDAVTVMGAWGDCTVSEQQLRRERVTVGGAVNFAILYRPENDGDAVPIKGTIDFQEVLELKGAADEDLLFLQAEVTDLRGMILNSRKIGIQCRVAVYAWVYQHDSMLLTEGVQSKPEEGIQLRLAHQQVRRLVTAFEKSIALNEEIRLLELAAGDQLLHTALQWKAEDIRTLNKKVMIRGAVQIRSLFLCEEETFRELEYSLPFSQIVESNDVRTDCSVELQYMTTQQKLRLERREDGLFLICTLNARTMMEVYQEHDLTTVFDLYSTSYHTEVKRAPMPPCSCQHIVLNRKLQEIVKTDLRVSRVLQYHCCGAMAEIKDGTLCGCFYVAIYWEDEEGCKKQQYVTLREELPMTGQYCGAAATTVANLAVTGTGEGFCVDLQVQYRLRSLGEEMREQVESCKLDVSRCRSGYAPGTLLLRTVCSEESTWDLAKAYGTTESAILSANHIMPDQTLEENQLVMIPFLRK